MAVALCSRSRGLRCGGKRRGFRSSGCGRGSQRSGGSFGGFGRRRRGAGLRSPRTCGFHVLAFTGQHCDHVIDRDVLRALGDQDLGDRALVDGLDLHGRLVGLDLGDDVAGFDLVAFLLQPLGEVALLHRWRKSGHQDVDGHADLTKNFSKCRPRERGRTDQVSCRCRLARGVHWQGWNATTSSW